jgi:hypothetical protein
MRSVRHEPGPTAMRNFEAQSSWTAALCGPERGAPARPRLRGCAAGAEPEPRFPESPETARRPAGGTARPVAAAAAGSPSMRGPPAPRPGTSRTWPGLEAPEPRGPPLRDGAAPAPGGWCQELRGATRVRPALQTGEPRTSPGAVLPAADAAAETEWRRGPARRRPGAGTAGCWRPWERAAWTASDAPTILFDGAGNANGRPPAAAHYDVVVGPPRPCGNGRRRSVRPAPRHRLPPPSAGAGRARPPLRPLPPRAPPRAPRRRASCGTLEKMAWEASAPHERLVRDAVAASSRSPGR